MNQTVTANIGGLVFHIEKEAYEKLQNYLRTISRYFDQSEGKEEIMGDIESRIAELLKDRLGASGEVVTMKDVDAVIDVMGQPEEYMDTDGSSDKDWQSAKSTHSKKTKRLYRDPDDMVVGGVCSGIGHFFGTDPVWIRLIFIAAFLFWGVGVILYFVLIIVIPKAQTTAEKLEMKGEPVNVDNIGKTIEDEMDRMKEKFNEFADRTTSGEFKPALKRFTNALQKVLAAILEFLTAVFKAAGKLVGVGFILIGLFVAFWLLAYLIDIKPVVTLASEGFNYYSLYDLIDRFTAGVSQSRLFLISAILLVGIPVVVFLMAGIHLLFGALFKTKGLGITTAIIWGASLITFIAMVFWISYEFRTEERIVQRSRPDSTAKLYHLRLNESKVDQAFTEMYDDDYVVEWHSSSQDHALVKFEHYFFSFTESNNLYGMPRLRIERSSNEELNIEIWRIAKGSTYNVANRNAQSIQYQVDQRDSTLLFDPLFEVSDFPRFREQMVEIVVNVPEGHRLYLNDNIEMLLHDIDNVSGYYDSEMGGHTWLMTDLGLECEDCD